MVFRCRGSSFTAEEGDTMMTMQSFSLFFIIATGSSLQYIAASIDNTSTESVTEVVETTAVPTTPPPTGIEDIIPKSVLTFVGLAVFILIGLVIAKMVDRFHDTVALRDDASDISEHTRDLLKTRLAIFAFSPAKIQSFGNKKQRDVDRARKFGRLWMTRAAMSSRKRREEARALPTVTMECETRTQNGSADVNAPSTSGSTATSPSAAGAATAGQMPKLTVVSFQPKEAKIDENKIEEPGGSKGKRNNEFIAIDIQNLDDSTATTKDGSTIPSTPRRSYIEFRDVGEDVTIPVRVVHDDALQFMGGALHSVPPKPKLAYADSVSSDFGSDLSVRQSRPGATVQTPSPVKSTKSHAAEGLEITSLSRDNSSESLNKLNDNVSASNSRPKTAYKKPGQGGKAPAPSRPITPGAGLRDSRPGTSRPKSSRVTTSRPLTAGRAQPITQGVRGFRIKSGLKSVPKRGR